MKKVLAIFALALFIGGISAPVFASDIVQEIVQTDDDPKKKDKKTSDKKAKKSTKAAACDGCTEKCDGCSDAEAAEPCEAKKSDCGSKCGGK